MLIKSFLNLFSRKRSEFPKNAPQAEQLAHLEKMAAIGTMVDGLTHQLNNRFHALTLIAGDTLDSIKLTDASLYTQEQKELFSQIQYGLERIQTNALQAGELVKGLLAYSRKAENNFGILNLDAVVDSALAMLGYKIKLNQIDIIKEYPKETTCLRGNRTALEEVFFNLIENAYDAMIERRDALKEPGYRGKIRIYTDSAHQGWIAIHIEDNGIGVKPENIKKLFVPFFTTKLGSHKGIGLGLYVIKKITTGNHNGRIGFSSVYKQGAAFTIELPVG